MKKRIANLLRRWAEALAPSPLPSITMERYELKEYRFRAEQTIGPRAPKGYHEKRAKHDIDLELGRQFREGGELDKRVVYHYDERERTITAALSIWLKNV